MSSTTTVVASDSFDSIISEFDQSQQQQSSSDKKPSLSQPDSSAFDSIVDNQNDSSTIETTTKAPDSQSFSDIVDSQDTSADPDKDGDDADKNKDATELSQFFEAIKELANEEEIALFDEDKPLDQYTKDDLKQLLKLNKENNIDTVKETAIKEFQKAKNFRVVKDKDQE